MPELPEVKTIQDQLNQVMPFEIKSVSKSKVITGIAHTPLTKLKGASIVEINRRGKLLDFRLLDGRHLLSHLGMTGTWLISKSKILEKHTHLQLKSEKGYLAYVDPRRFGHMYLYNDVEAQKKLNELGLDLLDPNFSYEYFKKKLLQYPARFLKVSLLDQSLFAGTGNYIASEICAHAGVRPDRKVETLRPRELKKLYEGIFQTIHPTIETGGTTFAGGYRDANGDKGKGVSHLIVFYQKICQQCLRTPITKITLGQRGTYYCPKCQK